MIVDETEIARWGFNEHFRAALTAWEGPGTSVGRVTIMHKGGLIVVTPEGELLAEASGQLRLDGRLGAADDPAVGDWVVLEPRPAEGTATIHGVLPRTTRIVRKAAGRTVTEQVVAANVDTILLALALGRGVNHRRLERLLTLAFDSGATPAVVLTKCDLAEDADAEREVLARIAPGVEIFAVSSKTGLNCASLDRFLVPGETLAIIGSSGVGKTTLINRWAGEDRGRVSEIRDDGTGRHTTTHRELIVLPSGALVIDTPGMRELGLIAHEEGLERAFAEVTELAESCRFRDCAHGEEPGCAVRAAVEAGTIPAERVESYRRLTREASHMDRVSDPRAKARAKAREKRMTRAFNRGPRRR